MLIIKSLYCLGSDAVWGHIREHCEIEVIDYSTTHYEIAQYDNNDFVKYMRETKGERPSWAKVRWINIAGISWDVSISPYLAALSC
jgi:hypothetical protein